MDSSEEGRGRRRYPLAKVKGGWTAEEDAVLKRWDPNGGLPAFGGLALQGKTASQGPSLLPCV